MPRPSPFDVKKLPTAKQVLLGSIICTIYFGVMVLLNYSGKHYIATGVIIEMATIPIIFLTIALLLYTCWYLFIQKQKVTLLWIISLCLQIGCAVFLVA